MQGKLLANVVNTTTANATNLVAGNATKTLVVPQGSTSTTVKVATNVGGGNYFPMKTTITSISAAVLTAPTGTSIKINIKKGTSYAASTLQTTITIPAGSKTASSVILITLNPNTDFVYYDVTQVGSPQSGVGLSVTYTYNTGY